MNEPTSRKPLRAVFVDTVIEALDTHTELAVLTADISSWFFEAARAKYPERVINVGIREQAMIGIAGGLALTGYRPVVHSYAPFLVERPFEQLKLDFAHQGVGAVLVSIGASYDDPAWGRTHQAPGDVALVDSLPGWSVHVPGHEAEFEPLLREALSADGRVYFRLSDRVNSNPVTAPDGFAMVRRGASGVVIAVGPTLDEVLAATSTADVTVLYSPTIRPFDHAGLRAAVTTARANVVLVEPYLRGTSAHEVADALADVPHRLRTHGVRRDRESHTYGTVAEHDRLNELDAESLSRSISQFVRE